MSNLHLLTHAMEFEYEDEPQQPWGYARVDENEMEYPDPDELMGQVYGSDQGPDRSAQEFYGQDASFNESPRVGEYWIEAPEGEEFATSELQFQSHRGDTSITGSS